MEQKFFGYPEFDETGEEILSTYDNEYSAMLMDVRVYRLKAGETPSEIMTATAKELYDLGQYRRNLQKEVIAAQHDPNLSDQDVADTVEAANKMLEAKGLKGLKTMHPAIRQAYLSRRAGKAGKKVAPAKTSRGTE